MKNSNPTQCQRILQRLEDGEWHSVTEFLQMYIPRYSARLLELKKNGYKFEKRKMPGKTYEEWRLIREVTIDMFVQQVLAH